ncbi:PH domain-containing protein [uncultured Tenacibaculum sp.]|uniref:PH domain-containing protein n=1 Tax=uncultured Tenacibaculum sp. TaxID=174713 RepID=UPI002621CE6E|nr:PH domain-containing protein [uncultured Tenacibaculum sp.]
MENQFQNNEVINFPDISKITFKSIEKRYLKVALLSAFSYILVIVPSIVLFLEKVIRKKEEDFPFYLVYISLAVLVILYILNIVLSFPKRKYVIRDQDITYKSGLITRKMVTVPFSRIQHVEIDEGVFSRFFKLASLSVYTAGDSSDDLEIKGLSKEQALQIKEFISGKINE